MLLFRAAYIASEFGSNGVGILLTAKEDSHLPDEELLAIAEKAAHDCGAYGEILIGEWSE